MILAVIRLNVSGGGWVEDQERLEQGIGFTAVLGAITAKHVVSRASEADVTVVAPA